MADNITVQKINLLLYGQVGAGKTTLCNKLGKYEKKTSAGGTSCTRTYFENPAQYHDYYIIDMPGTAAIEEQKKHIIIQMHLLNETNYSGILVLIPWEHRQDTLVKSLNNHMKLLWRFTAWVCVGVTKCEGIDESDKQSAVKYIRDIVDKKTPVWFIGEPEKIDWEKTSAMIYQRLKDSHLKEASREPMLVETDIELYADVTSFRKEAKELSNKLMKEFRDVDGELREQLTQSTDDDFIRALLIVYKAEASRKADEMHEKLGQQMIGFDLYIEYINFKRDIAKFVEKFERDAKEKFSFKFHQTNTGGKAENYNRFRKCPHCGLIWFKVTACPNTSCGARLNSPDIFQNGDSLCGYIFKWVGNKLTWEVDKQSVKILRVADSYKSQRKEEPQGCGKAICWDECEDVTNEVMGQLKEAQIRDFVASGQPKERFDISDALQFKDDNFIPPTNSNGVVSVPQVQPPQPPQPVQPVQPVQSQTSQKLVTIRKLNQKRGGIKIKAGSLDEILQLGKKEFNKDVICVREGDEEVKITDLSLLEDGAIVYLTTAEEEKDNF